MENEIQEEEDAITVLTAKSVELFLKIRKEITDGLTRAQLSDSEANQVALALTPKPIEMLSVIYTGVGENLDYEETLETETETEMPEIPDDEILSGYQRGGLDAEEINKDENQNTGN